MATMNISLPDPMRKYLEEKVAAGGYGTVSEYIRELIREDQKRAADERLARELLAGLESGPPLKGDVKYWEKKKREVLARWAGGKRS